MAAYGAQLKEGKTPAQAQEYLKALFHNVVSQDSSARNALQTFLAGRGDALIDYENEAIADEKKGARDRIRDPEGHDPDPEPGRRRRHGQRRRGAEVRQLPALAGRPGDLGREGLPAGDRRACRARAVPDAAGAVHDRIARRLEGRDQAVLRTGNRDRHQDRAVAGSRPLPNRGPARRRSASGRRWIPPAAVARARAGGADGGRAARPACSARGCWASTCPSSCCCRWRRCSPSPTSGGTSAFWREILEPRGAARRSS